MDFLLEKLNVLTATWKVLLTHGTEPDIPLKWEADPYGMLRLDNIWIAPAKYVDISRLETCAKTVQDVCFEVPMDGELLEIIIIRKFGKYEIHTIERHV